MLVKDAKAIARQWVSAEASGAAGFVGAFFHGSSNWLPDDATLPATSDLDVMVVLADPSPATKLGKFIYRDVLLEISYLSDEEVRSPEYVLGQYHLAGSFRTASVIADPSGRLAPLQAAVAREYARRPWVVRRCEQARDKVLRGYQLRESDPLPDQVNAWLFPTGVMTHVLLVAGLRNPTVRTRYLAARELLADYGRPDFYEALLEPLGCARMDPAQVERHLDALAEMFDAASELVRTPFFFASDISPAARPIAIDGSREMIARGDHREAVFWIAATACRCQKILAADAPAEVQERFLPPFLRLLADLGITSLADLGRRMDEGRALLPEVWQVAQAILAANPAIEE